MIQMIQPVIPQLFDSDKYGVSEWISFILCAVAILAASMTIALLVARYANGRYKGNKKKTYLCFAGITALVTITLICFFGFAAITVKGIIFTVILALSSYEDIRTRECDDYLHVMIVIAAFIGIEFSLLPEMLLSAVVTGAVMLLPPLSTRSKIGGADIKFAVACAFMLGLRQGMIGLLSGMTLAILFNEFKKDKKKGFPMIPYMAVGFMTAFFI